MHEQTQHVSSSSLHSPPSLLHAFCYTLNTLYVFLCIHLLPSPKHGCAMWHVCQWQALAFRKEQEEEEEWEEEAGAGGSRKRLVVRRLVMRTRQAGLGSAQAAHMQTFLNSSSPPSVSMLRLSIILSCTSSTSSHLTPLLSRLHCSCSFSSVYHSSLIFHYALTLFTTSQMGPLWEWEEYLLRRMLPHAMGHGGGRQEDRQDSGCTQQPYTKKKNFPGRHCTCM